MPAAVKAVEALDQCLGRVLEAVKKSGYAMLLTADHGNCELMVDPGSGGPHTAHTTNPVPFLFIGEDEKLQLRSDGALQDIAPTLLSILGIPVPPDMTGRDLRLDLFRGLALWLIFLDHIPSNVVSWITIRNYGFSDATEIFIFISGYTAAFVYGRAMADRGFVVAAGLGQIKREVLFIAAQHLVRALPVEKNLDPVFPRQVDGEERRLAAALRDFRQDRRALGLVAGLCGERLLLQELRPQAPPQDGRLGRRLQDPRLAHERR